MGYKKWNKAIFWMLLGFSLCFAAASEIILFKINENLGFKEAVAVQIEENRLYGRLLIGQEWTYKGEMAKTLRPEIIAMGSSRVMQFREQFFKGATFYTTGGAMPNLDSGIALINEIGTTYHPKIVILGVDLWWLNGNFNDTLPSAADIKNNNFFQDRIFLYKSLANKLTGTEYKAVFAPILGGQTLQGNFDPVGGRKSIGLPAALKGEGFRLDGSYQYGKRISGEPQPDENFADTHKRIKDGVSRFEYANGVDATRFEKLNRLLDLLQSAGSEVVVFIPPLPDEIYETMAASDNHKFFLRDFEAKVQTACEARNISFYNFGNMKWVGSSDDEALDGFHGSERTYAKIALQMQADHVLGQYIDRERIAYYLQATDHKKDVIPYQE